MDWNNDGTLDILTGCYWTSKAEASHLQILLGQGGNNFAKPVAINADSGEPLLNVPHRDVPEGERKYDWRNLCTHPFAADVDNDGDLDILVGNLKSMVYFHQNKGTAGQPVFDDYGVELLEFPDTKASPFLHDWDGDDDLDLLTGGDAGAIYLAYNEGDKSNPDWQQFSEIISSGQTDGGSISKLCVADWNNDGLPDVLVGTQNGQVRVFLQRAE